MKIMAIDPGTFSSAFVVYDLRAKVLDRGLVDNKKLLGVIEAYHHLDHLVIEQIKSYGNVMGDSVLSTCVWTGRFIQAWGKPHTLLPRKTVVTHLCDNPRAKDKNVRQALIDLFSERDDLGGGKTPAIGTTIKPGPLFNVKKDIWSALAVAVVWAGIHKFKSERGLLR